LIRGNSKSNHLGAQGTVKPYILVPKASSLVVALHAEYAERRRKCEIIFRFSLFCEYIDLEYIRVPVIYRVNQAISCRG